MTGGDKQLGLAQHPVGEEVVSRLTNRLTEQSTLINYPVR